MTIFRRTQCSSTARAARHPGLSGSATNWRASFPRRSPSLSGRNHSNTDEMVKRCRESDPGMEMTDCHPLKLSQRLWPWIQHTLHGSTELTFDSCAS